MCLTNPDLALKFLDRNKLSREEKNLYLLALQVKQKTLDVTLANKDYGRLQSVLPAHLRKIATVKVSILDSIEYPEINAELKDFSQKLNDAIGRVRESRTQIEKILEGRSLPQKIEVREQAKHAEKRIYELIMASPLLNGLSEEEKVEYGQNLSAAASEFKKPSTAHGLAKVRSESLLEKQKNQPQSFTLQFVSRAGWEWNDSDRKDVVFKMLDQRHINAALIFLDFWFSQNKITKAQYDNLWSGVMVTEVDNPFVRDYVMRKLIAEKRSDIVQAWRGKNEN